MQIECNSTSSLKFQIESLSTVIYGMPLEWYPHTRISIVFIKQLCEIVGNYAKIILWVEWVSGYNHYVDSQV